MRRSKVPEKSVCSRSMNFTGTERGTQGMLYVVILNGAVTWEGLFKK